MIKNILYDGLGFVLFFGFVITITQVNEHNEPPRFYDTTGARTNRVVRE